MSKYDNPKYKPACKVCSSVGLRHFCKDCDLPLCFLPCFEYFHKDFKRAREQSLND